MTHQRDYEGKKAKLCWSGDFDEAAAGPFCLWREMGGGGMSYTMTMDMPPKATAFVERSGLRFRNELNALVLAFVTVRMQADSEMSSKEAAARSSEGECLSGLDFFNELRAGAPLLDDEEMQIFDRVKDYGRKVDLT